MKQNEAKLAGTKVPTIKNTHNFHLGVSVSHVGIDVTFGMDLLVFIPPFPT